jgi:uncharacterized protein YodC (DUF2158 family)
MTFNVGDPVWLKSGGCEMVVIGIKSFFRGAFFNVICCWHDKNGKPHSKSYPSEVLITAEEKQRKEIGFGKYSPVEHERGGNEPF